MGTPYSNRLGRQPGRGVRPWLLLPKVVAVGLYLGGLGAALVFWMTGRIWTLDKADPKRLWIIDQTGWMMELLVVPSLLLAILFGIALLLQHPGLFIRMRWLQVKLASLIMLVPAAHLFLSSRLAMLRSAFAQQIEQDEAAWQFAWGLGLTLLVSTWIVVVGRLKPRFRQNWARAYEAGTKEREAAKTPRPES